MECVAALTKPLINGNDVFPIAILEPSPFHVSLLRCGFLLGIGNLLNSVALVTSPSRRLVGGLRLKLMLDAKTVGERISKDFFA